MYIKKIKKLSACLVFTCFLSACQINNINNPQYKLFYAIDSENLEMAKEAVAAGADVNHFDSKRLRERLWHNEIESNPILVAINRGSIQIAEYLLECGADVNYVNDSGRSILSYCAEFRKDIVHTIINKGADVNYIDQFGNTALDYSLMNDRLSSLDSFTTLLNYNPEIKNSTLKKVIDNMIDNPEITKNYIVSKMLFDKGYSIEALDITYAFLGKSDELMDLVKSKMYDTNHDGVLLSAAAAFGSSECAEYLYQNTDGKKIVSANQLFRLSAMFGNIENMKYFLSVGADINSRDFSDYSAFELSAFNNQIKSISFLLELGADLTPSTKNFEKDALCFAIQNKNFDMLQMLLPYIQNFNLGHALGTAIEVHNNEALKALLDMGTDPNYGIEVTNLLGKSVKEYNWDAIRMLLEYGAGVNAETAFTPLVQSIRYGYKDMTNYLIKNGALVNVSKNYQGAPENIPVIVAIQYGQFEILKLLIENGAQITDLKYYGKNVLEFAEKCGSDNIYQYLCSVLKK